MQRPKMPSCQYCWVSH